MCVHLVLIVLTSMLRTQTEKGGCIGQQEKPKNWEKEEAEQLHKEIVMEA